MDKTDKKIIQILQQNARTPITQIASQVSLSVPAVSERLKKLESSGLVKRYTAILDAKSLGKTLTALMFISLERPRYNEEFIAQLQDEQEVLECHYLAGDFDYVLKVITRDTSTLEQLLNRIKGIKGVQKTRTIVALSTVKECPSITLGEEE
jgi:Lrp/AsnC family transcriptional regulator, leucine-responsive regulatory protein